MKKISFLVLIAILGLTVSSCSNDKTKEAEETSQPTIKVTAAGKAKAEETDPLAEAVEDTEIEREQDIVGLIPATKPEIRVRGSVRGREDPFATIAVQPNIKVEPEEVDNSVASTNQPSLPNNPTPNNNTATRPSNITSTPTIETLETPESLETPKSLTELADNVLITGLVELGDRIRLIVQAPEEATSRYVDIGQYVSNGKVLVKRIESNYPVPTVILEQSGIEVAKVIGGQTEEDPEDSEDDQAILPPPPSSTTSVSWLSNYLSQVSNNSLIK